ncbi:MAG: hypothetical protein LBK00_11045 [Treponema sp.]|jgi:hypothetical protein|nr:hypothetical protein [Treponema sp.]
MPDPFDVDGLQIFISNLATLKKNMTPAGIGIATYSWLVFNAVNHRPAGGKVLSERTRVRLSKGDKTPDA